MDNCEPEAPICCGGDSKACMTNGPCSYHLTKRHYADKKGECANCGCQKSTHPIDVCKKWVGPMEVHDFDDPINCYCDKCNEHNPLVNESDAEKAARLEQENHILRNDLANLRKMLIALGEGRGCGMQGFASDEL